MAVHSDGRKDVYRGILAVIDREEENASRLDLAGSGKTYDIISYMSRGKGVSMGGGLIFNTAGCQVCSSVMSP